MHVGENLSLDHIDVLGLFFIRGHGEDRAKPNMRAVDAPLKAPEVRRHGAQKRLLNGKRELLQLGPKIQRFGQLEDAILGESIRSLGVCNTLALSVPGGKEAWND